MGDLLLEEPMKTYSAALLHHGLRGGDEKPAPRTLANQPGFSTHRKAATHTKSMEQEKEK